jgi:hypothetical protein
MSWFEVLKNNTPQEIVEFLKRKLQMMRTGEVRILPLRNRVNYSTKTPNINNGQVILPMTFTENREDDMKKLDEVFRLLKSKFGIETELLPKKTPALQTREGKDIGFTVSEPIVFKFEAGESNAVMAPEMPDLPPYQPNLPPVPTLPPSNP